MDKIRILKTLSKQFIAQEKYEEAVKCLEAASNAVDALPVERATACVQMAILVLEYFDEVDFARAKLLQAVCDTTLRMCLCVCTHICMLFHMLLSYRNENWLQQLNSKKSCMPKQCHCWFGAAVRRMML